MHFSKKLPLRIVEKSALISFASLLFVHWCKVLYGLPSGELCSVLVGGTLLAAVNIRTQKIKDKSTIPYIINAILVILEVTNATTPVFQSFSVTVIICSIATVISIFIKSPIIFLIYGIVHIAKALGFNALFYLASIFSVFNVLIWGHIESVQCPLALLSNDLVIAQNYYKKGVKFLIINFWGSVSLLFLILKILKGMYLNEVVF